YLCLTQLKRLDDAKIWEGRYQRLKDDMDKMTKLSQTILQKPVDPDLRQQIGAIHLYHGRETEGLRWIDSALQIVPAHRASHQTLADYFERQGKKERADYHRRMAQGTAQAPTR